MVQVIDRGEVAGEVSIGSFDLRTARLEIAGAEKISGGNDGDAHGAVFVCAFGACDAVLNPERETHISTCYTKPHL
jgi:hypothetical protein